MHSKLLPNLLLTICFLLCGSDIFAQTTEQARDSSIVSPENDTLDFLNPLQRPDTVDNAIINDTIQQQKSEPIDSPVDYKANDSIVYALDERKVYLYGESQILYKEIELNAGIIEFNMGDEVVFAQGRPDSTGKLTGKPHFIEGSESFDANLLSYNFRTKKGIIKQIYSEQEGGFLHSETTKRHPNSEIHLKGGKYTTCDLEHPHFYIALTKAKSIPGDKIISGPAYFVIEDVPLPIGIPFGFFPTTKTNKSGVLIPTYGEERRRGFFLRNGGYYMALSQYADLRLTTDIYTNGTWGARLASNYRKRYKFSGSFGFNYYQNVSGEKGLTNYKKTKDYALVWSHAQDAKANPTRRFSASVNFTTSSFDRNHTRNVNNVMRSTKQSNISLSKVWPNSPFNFSTSANASQNTFDRSMNIRLPQMALNMNRIYPFRRKSKVGKAKWYENIQLSYSSTLENRLNTKDTSLFKSTWDDFDKAYQHNIPVSLNLKALRYFTISPNIRYTGVLFTKTIHPQYIKDFLIPNTDTRVDTFLIDTVSNLKYAHAYVPSIGINFSPKIYGMFQFREKSRIEAIRHVMTPRASFSYSPDMKGKVPDYYREIIIDSTGKTKTYSLFDESIYRTPVPSGRSGTVNLSLMNNIEMKLKPEDEKENYTKVKILNNLNFSTNYNIFKDSMRCAPIAMNGNTGLFKNRVILNFNGRFDPYSYVVDSRGMYRSINTSLWKDRHRLVRLTSFGFSLGTSFKSGQGARSIEQREEDDLTAITGEDQTGYDDVYYGEYVDFNVPWSLGFDYNFSYRRTGTEPNIVQSLRIRGDLSLTPKWKIGFNSGYDFTVKKVSMTNLNIYRDLHCWEMQITLVPFGTYRSYSFRINIKSSVLRDVKYEKRDNWFDNF